MRLLIFSQSFVNLSCVEISLDDDFSNLTKKKKKKKKPFTLTEMEESLPVCIAGSDNTKIILSYINIMSTQCVVTMLGSVVRLFVLSLNCF